MVSNQKLFIKFTQRINDVNNCVWCLNCLFTPVVSRPMADGDSSSTISDSSTENAGTGVVQTSASVSSSHGRESGGAELFGIQLEVSILLCDFPYCLMTVYGI